MKTRICFTRLLRTSIAASVVVAGLLGGAISSEAQTAADGDERSGKVFPRVSDLGGVYPIESPAALPSGGDYRLVFDVTEAGSKDQLHGSIEHVARALNLYALAGVAHDDVSIAMVIHGDATPIVLRDDAYRRAFGMPNPNTRSIAMLNDMGVTIEVCGQALHHAGFTPDQVSPKVATVLAAITALVDHQRDGYALIP